MFFLCFSDPSFSFSATFTVNKYTLNLTWRDLGRPPWLALVVAPPLLEGERRGEMGDGGVGGGTGALAWVEREGAGVGPAGGEVEVAAAGEVAGGGPRESGRCSAGGLVGDGDIFSGRGGVAERGVRRCRGGGDKDGNGHRTRRV